VSKANECLKTMGSQGAKRRIRASDSLQHCGEGGKNIIQIKLKKRPTT